MQTPSLLPLLARTLREDGRWNMDLSISIASVLFAHSHFSELHGSLIELRIGTITMDMLERTLRKTGILEVGLLSCSSAKTDHMIKCTAESCYRTGRIAISPIGLSIQCPAGFKAMHSY
jgi:hypothetical protein